MTGHYTELATIYDKIGMSQFTHQTIPLILDYAQRNDWLGRNIMEFGCGTGAAGAWLADNSYGVTGIDQSAAMLEIANSKANSQMGLSVTWHQGDIRQVNEQLGTTEMVIAIDVMNEMDGIKDIQAVLSNAFQALRSEKPLIFDMYTIEGLTKNGTSGQKLTYDDNHICVMSQNSYDYEKQRTTEHFITFQRQENDNWTRLDTQQIRRAYPIQAIVSLMQRVGFTNINIFDNMMRPINNTNNLERVFFMAYKS